MARETKTIQLYPDDKIVNDTIAAYEIFGWEVINNQRCQEFTRQDSNGTKHYSTFNKVTFSREKASSWYPEVSELEREFDALEAAQNPKNTTARLNACRYFGITTQTATKPVMPRIGNGKPAMIKGIMCGSAFLLGLIMFILSGTVFSNNDLLPLFLLISFALIVLTIIWGIQALINLKHLKGLKGQEAKDAKDKYEADLKEYNNITASNSAKMRDLDQKIKTRKSQIIARCRQIVR